jgi:hypothetical protein
MAGPTAKASGPVATPTEGKTAADSQPADHAGAAPPKERFKINVPIDRALADSEQPGRELSIRFLQDAFAKLPDPIIIDRLHAERIIDRIGWRVHSSTDDKLRAHLNERLSEGKHTISYYTEELPDAVRAFREMQHRDIQRMEEAMEAFHKCHFAEDALLDFLIGHYNGLIGVVNGILDIPVAPANLVKSAVGEEPDLHFLGRIPRIEYRSEWGKKNGGAMEAGVALSQEGLRIDGQQHFSLPCERRLRCRGDSRAPIQKARRPHRPLG